MLETFNSAEKTLVLRSNHVSRDFLQKMSKLREANNFVDVTLTSGPSSDEIEIEIPAHKIILHVALLILKQCYVETSKKIQQILQGMAFKDQYILWIS